LIAGYSCDEDENVRACVWKGGTPSDLGTFGGDDSIARGINNFGQVVGEADVESGDYHAFLWQDGKMQDLGTFGGESSKALGVNDHTQIIGGLVDLSGYWRPWIWEDGSITYLGSLGGGNASPKCINNLGQVVGGSSTAGYEWHAFLWENEVMFDLNDYIPDESGWILDTACAINDSGWIAGYGTLEGESRAFLLTPVPEPVSISWIVMPLLFLLVKRKCS
jgi:probable HAF family extracellular repeat protein